MSDAPQSYWQVKFDDGVIVNVRCQLASEAIYDALSVRGLATTTEDRSSQVMLAVLKRIRSVRFCETFQSEHSYHVNKW